VQASSESHTARNAFARYRDRQRWNQDLARLRPLRVIGATLRATTSASTTGGFAIPAV
jgi:hypothetical protein